MYITLYNGRNHPAEVLEDWGFEGPTLGPFTDIQWTYGVHLKMSTPTDEHEELTFSDDGEYVVHDGKYYGDFNITTTKKSN